MTVVSARTLSVRSSLAVVRLGQQRFVQPGDRVVPATGGDLHQRGRMRHPGTKRNPAKSLPGNRIGHLPAQRLIAQPVAELQKHQPQIGLHRNRRTTDPGIEIRRERREEHRIIQQHIHPAQLGRQHQQLGRQDRIPQRRLVVYSTKHDVLESFSPRVRGHHPSSATFKPPATPRLFQVEVAKLLN